MYKYHYNTNKLTELRKTFIYFIDKLDTLRKTNWSKTFPELYKSTLKMEKIIKADKGLIPSCKVSY